MNKPVKFAKMALVVPAFVAVITPAEPDVLTFQAAINHGVTDIYEQNSAPREVVGSIVNQLSDTGGKASTVQ